MAIYAARRRAAASRSRFAASSSFAIGRSRRRRSSSIDDVTFARDCFGKLTKRLPVLLEVVPANRKHLDTQAAQVAELVPDRREIQLEVWRSIRQDGHQVPVTVGAMRAPSTATEQPNLVGIEHLDDALDDSRRDDGRDHEQSVPSSDE